MPVKKSPEETNSKKKSSSKAIQAKSKDAGKGNGSSRKVPEKTTKNGSALPAAKPAAQSGISAAGTAKNAFAAVVQAVKRIKKPSRKAALTAPAPPPVEVSDFPKLKVRHILVSQPKPSENDKNAYVELGRKHHVQVSFRQFIKVEGLTAQDFRAQRIDILEHGAVILTSKMAVDHYFRLCNELRITVPETMKYFCINEQTAYYLQKYIQYRKRKIFFGHGTIIDLVDVIRKNRAEKFLLPASDVQKEQIVDFLEDVNITFTKAVFYKSVCADLSDMKSLAEFDVLVFFTPVGIKALKQNFPNFKQGNTRIAAFGHSSAATVKSLGYRLDIFAPNPQNPSMSGALEAYIKEANRR